MNYSELYKDTSGGSYYARLNPYETGTFTISYLSYKTLFEKYQPDQVTKTFLAFEDNRVVISHRIGAINPYTGGLDRDGRVCQGVWVVFAGRADPGLPGGLYGNESAKDPVDE